MKHGLVTSTESTDEGLILATVAVQRAGVTYQQCPVAHSFSGESQSLEEGSRVLLEQTDDGLWVIMGVLTTDSDELPSDMSAQERVMSFDDGTEISVRQKNDGYKIEITASEDIRIESGGHIQFKADTVDFDTS